MIGYFVVLGLLLDLFLTYKFLNLYRLKFPKKDYLVVEANPLIRFMVRRAGLGTGMIYSGVIIMVILLWLLMVLPHHWKYFLLGVYYMMVTFHLTNFLAIRRIKGVKK